MKRFKLFLLLAALFCGSATFTGCSDDDGGGANNPLIGTWKYTFSTGYHLYYFGNNGHGWEQEYDNGRWGSKHTLKYNYLSSINQIIIVDDEGYTLTIDIISLTSDFLVCRYDESKSESETWYRVN